MSENVQPLITWNAQGRALYPGVDVSGLDAQFGTGNFLALASFNNVQWVRVRHTAAGDDAFVNTLGAHHFVHPLLDPLILKGLPFIIRITEMIRLDFGAATQGRIFFGFGEWIDVTDDDSLRGLGFYTDETGNWFALLSDALGDRVRLDTGVETLKTHFLRIELDGILKQVRWYIDDVLITTETLTTPLDQIATGTELRFYDVGIRSTGQQIDAYVGSGMVAQMSLITNEPEPVVVLAEQLTYQDVVNLARTRASEFAALVLDDQQVFKELNAMCLQMVQEGSDADHTTFQEVMNWATTVLPTITTIPAPTDLRDVDHIEIPIWVNTIYAAEGVKADNKKIQIDVSKKESEIRDRATDEESTIFTSLRDPRLNRPRAFKVWDSGRGRWKLFKDENLLAPGNNPWEDIIDANLIVSGVRLQMFARSDLTDTIPLPYRALIPMAEAFAITLGMRAGKDRGWVQDQRTVAEAAMTHFREFINMMDMATDEPFDPEIGQF